MTTLDLGIFRSFLRASLVPITQGVARKIAKSAVQIVSPPIERPIPKIKIGPAQTSNNIHDEYRNRRGSVAYTLEIAHQLSEAMNNLRSEAYTSLSIHIEKYIDSILLMDPQYSLIALRELRERMDIFLQQDITQKIQSATTLYAPASEHIHTWFRNSEYKVAQAKSIKMIESSKYVTALIVNCDGSIKSALSHRSHLSYKTQDILSHMKTKIDELISSISYDTIYQECFSILDATTVRLLSRWDILDPRLEPMIIDHHRSHTDIATTSIDIEELLAINLIFRNKTPNSIS